MNREEIEGLIGTVLDCAEECRVRYLRPAMAKDLRDTAAALRAQRERIDALEAEKEQMAHQWNAVQDLALLPALPPGEPTDDEVRDWAYNTLATDTDGDTRGVWWSTITPARKGMYRRAMLAARPAPPTETK